MWPLSQWLTSLCLPIFLAFDSVTFRTISPHATLPLQTTDSCHCQVIINIIHSTCELLSCKNGSLWAGATRTKWTSKVTKPEGIELHLHITFKTIILPPFIPQHTLTHERTHIPSWYVFPPQGFLRSKLQEPNFLLITEKKTTKNKTSSLAVKHLFYPSSLI